MLARYLERIARLDVDVGARVGESGVITSWASEAGGSAAAVEQPAELGISLALPAAHVAPFEIAVEYAFRIRCGRLEGGGRRWHKVAQVLFVCNVIDCNHANVRFADLEALVLISNCAITETILTQSAD